MNRRTFLLQSAAAAGEAAAAASIARATEVTHEEAGTAPAASPKHHPLSLRPVSLGLRGANNLNGSTRTPEPRCDGRTWQETLLTRLQINPSAHRLAPC